MAKQTKPPEPETPADPPAPPPPPLPEDDDDVHLADGICCPACGRDQVPRIVATKPAKRQRFADCSLCGARIRITYRENGSPLRADRV